MKKLTRLKMINWHRFTNCTVNFGSSTLLAGENSSGKSTILDAIQYVVLCTANYFNIAAHENANKNGNGNRKLTGYIRCKTGKENNPYERTGAISAHVALEFYEESKDQYFILGAAIDSSSEGQERTGFYLIDRARLNDDMFFNGKAPRSISEFRSYNDNIKQWCNTQTEARKMVKARLGRIEDKFFSLMPKALAFNPIDDIKNFVYSYVLDKKEVNIEVLQENVRTYQDLERTLDSVKNRIVKLEAIEKFHQEVEDYLLLDQKYEYFLARVQLESTRDQKIQLESEVQTDGYRLKECEQSLMAKETEKEKTQEMETNLRVELRQDKEFVALEEQRRLLEQLQATEQRHLEELGELKESVELGMSQVRELMNISDVDDCVRTYESLFSRMDRIEDVAEAKQLVDQVIAYKRRSFETIRNEMTKMEISAEENHEEHRKLEAKIRKLEQNQLSYDESVTCLIQEIRKDFDRIGRDVEPSVLCELLEITDDSWRNAVEGYLNTQRFYVLVEPENFDVALGTYDRLRREKRAYGAGLINMQNMDAYDMEPEDTLAMVVTSKNHYAKQYINMVLGKVHMCERYEELKQYPVSITKECMCYQNRVANAIRPEIFSVHFIGQHAFKVQLAQAKERISALEEIMAQNENRMRNMQKILNLLSTDTDVDIKFRLDVLTNISIVRSRIETCRNDIKALEENTTLIQKQMQLQRLESLRKKLEKEISESNQQIGMLKNSIEAKKERIGLLADEQLTHQTRTAELETAAGDNLPVWTREYEKQLAGRGYEQFRENYDRRRKANDTSRKNSENQMEELMIEYKTAYDFGASANMEGFPEFAAIYSRLKTSELLNYEEKVQSARKAAEEEFREQFLAKLQENIKLAQNEFRELNKALKDIVFSNEKYEFLFMPSKRYRNYYEMIMDDFNAMQGVSIFSGIFHETHKAVIEELFDRLAVSKEDSAKTLDEFTDYRTYMDYDIKIIHSDGSYSYYSKVCGEKSGGETQTPFYVTVAASFVQLYNNNIGGEAAGLIMFDEAFHNMDDERIGGVLEFFNRLPLQIIIAAPPGKIQFIGPAMDETVLVMTDEKVSYVESFYNSY